MLKTLATVEQMSLPPQGAGTVRALSRIGYELPAAIADIIDNSIDAGAARIEITFLRNDREITAVTIADDGCGMDNDTLLMGMQFAGRTAHKACDLGTYGMGLKSASFSQCSTMTVVTRQAQKTIASRWSVEAIGSDWQCDILDPQGATAAFDMLCMRGRIPPSGTIVIWERLDRLAVGSQINALDEFLSTALPRLEAHLGLVFHRFLKRGTLTISLIVRHEQRSLAIPRTVREHDPFGYSYSASPFWPQTLVTDLPNVGIIKLDAHIWPPSSSADNFLLASSRGLEFQGFYFYRNHRLIQAGGWNGVVKSDSDPILSLARVAIDLPPGGFDVNVQKSAIQVTAAQSHALLAAANGEYKLSSFLDKARAAYQKDRKAGASGDPLPVVPGQGLAPQIQAAALHQLAKTELVEAVTFDWEELEPKNVFELDLSETRIILNSRYRTDILGGAPMSQQDAPLVKMLIFLMFKDDLSLMRSTQKLTKRVDLCNALLFEVLRNK